MLTSLLSSRRWRLSLQVIALGLAVLAVVASLQDGFGAQTVTVAASCLLAGLCLKVALIAGVAGTDRSAEEQVRVVSALLDETDRSVDQVVEQLGAVVERLDTAVADVFRLGDLVFEHGLVDASEAETPAALATRVDQALAELAIAQNEVLELRDLIVRIERRALNTSHRSV